MDWYHGYCLIIYPIMVTKPVLIYSWNMISGLKEDTKIAYNKVSGIIKVNVCTQMSLDIKVRPRNMERLSW
jgi:hypothetical protein